MSKFKKTTNSFFKLKQNVFFSNIYDTHKSYSVRDKLKLKILKHGINVCKIEKTEDEIENVFVDIVNIINAEIYVHNTMISLTDGDLLKAVNK
jgi:hypothetical protein